MDEKTITRYLASLAQRLQRPLPCLEHEFRRVHLELLYDLKFLNGHQPFEVDMFQNWRGHPEEMTFLVRRACSMLDNGVATQLCWLGAREIDEIFRAGHGATFQLGSATYGTNHPRRLS